MITLPLLPQGRSNNFFYGSLSYVITICALTVVFLFLQLLFGLNPRKLMFIANEISLIVACVIGIYNERADEVLNEQAIARGEEPPHLVDSKEALYMTYGGLACYIPSIMTRLVNL